MQVYQHVRGEKKAKAPAHAHANAPSFFTPAAAFCLSAVVSVCHKKKCGSCLIAMLLAKLHPSAGRDGKLLVLNRGLALGRAKGRTNLQAA
jgi:hypothetical protein